MKYQLKEGFPEEDEIVYGTVVDITNRVVIVRLDEFKKNITGILYPHEVAPGRIRNIRDYVKKGKRVVCVVLDSDKKTQRINLSLRRVQKKIRDKKLRQVKQRKIAEKIIENIAKLNDMKPQELYDELLDSLPEDVPSLEVAFQRAVDDDLDLSKYYDNEDILKPLKSAIKGRFKPKRVQVKYNVKVITSQSSGVNLIKDIFSKVKKYDAEVLYLGGGKYEVRVERKNYRTAEKDFDEIRELLEKELRPKSEEFSIEKNK